MGKFFVTTPIYYVNDEPHIGHAYTTVLADVLARYYKERGDDVFFLTGTDEHGQKVFRAARDRGMEPKQHCDETVVRFKDLWEKLNINYTHFIRTTDPEHEKVVKQILQTIYDKGDIYFDEYSGYYCIECERFYTEKELQGPSSDVPAECPIHRTELKVISEENYFFKMSNYRQRLIDHIGDHPQFILPDFRRNEVLGFLKQPLGDLCISRPKSRLSWGIELPFDSDYVTYVWFDALINYVSAIGVTENDSLFRKWWPANYHLIGKDILTTHAVYWPTMLFAADIAQPETIFAHGWWLSEDFKMSKSMGNVVRPLDLIEEFGVDPVRYFLMRDMVLGQDANFSLEAFVRRYNSDLANDLGNLVGRICALIRSHFAGEIPPSGDLGEEEVTLRRHGERVASVAHDQVERMRISAAVEEVLQFVRVINRYMERREPWKLVRSDKERAGTVLYFAAESLRIVLQQLHPIMPARTEKMLEMIGVSEPDFMDHEWGKLERGAPLGSFEVPFPRIELEKKSVKIEEEGMTREEIAIEDFAKLDLRTAEVVAAEAVSGTDKLVKLQIRIGEDERQIVAGIAEHYSPEKLVGKMIVVLTNLKSAVIRGEESKGMLLAASGENSIILLTVDDPDIGSGARIS
ncbi:MAG: methionine--tRNA ligase [Candidatus Neomarinimicrobiota bacterium]